MTPWISSCIIKLSSIPLGYYYAKNSNSVTLQLILGCTTTIYNQMFIILHVLYIHNDMYFSHYIQLKVSSHGVTQLIVAIM